jgi:hypothetical protein
MTNNECYNSCIKFHHLMMLSGTTPNIFIQGATKLIGQIVIAVWNLTWLCTFHSLPYVHLWIIFVCPYLLAASPFDMEREVIWQRLLTEEEIWKALG